MSRAIEYVREAIDAVVDAKSRAQGSDSLADLDAASESLVRAESTLEGEEEEEPSTDE